MVKNNSGKTIPKNIFGIHPAREARREKKYAFDLVTKGKSLRKSTRRAKRAGKNYDFDIVTKAKS